MCVCACVTIIKGNHLFESGGRAFGGKKRKGKIELEKSSKE